VPRRFCVRGRSAARSLKKGRPEPAWFAEPAPNAALDSEAEDIERFLTS